MRTLLRTFGVLTLVALSGCAAMQRDARARELAGEYVYPKPLSEVWPHVVALLTAQGYVPHAGEKQDVIETDWKQEVSGSSASGAWSRYVVVGKDDGKTCVVRILRNTRAVEGQSRVSESNDDRTVGNEDAADGKSVEHSRYGTNTESSGPLKKDDEASASDAIAGNRATTAGAGKVAGTRDLNMEWLLLQRVDPEGAAKIFAQAEPK